MTQTLLKLYVNDKEIIDRFINEYQMKKIEIPQMCLDFNESLHQAMSPETFEDYMNFVIELNELMK